VTACRDKICFGAGEKEGEGWVEDEEMLDGQGGMAEFYRNPDLIKW
jgi:hypothetical protein